MPLYRSKNSSLSRIKENRFSLEKNIQNLTEKNLQSVFGLDFVRPEFPLRGLRVDTLAFDNQTKSFVIIEYKKDKNFSVIDQGYSYLSLLLNNKADFILEYNENKNKNLSKKDVNWTESKVIFISPSFSKYQLQAINFKDLPLELWEIKKYENDLIQYLQIKSQESTESIKTISKKSPDLQNVSKEIKVYSENDHIDKVDNNIKELYNKIKSQALDSIDSLSVNPTKYYISLKKDKNFAYIMFSKKKIRLVVKYPEEKASKYMVYHHIKKLPQKVQKFWGGPSFEIVLEEDKYVIEIVNLLKTASEY